MEDHLFGLYAGEHGRIGSAAKVRSRENFEGNCSPRVQSKFKAIKAVRWYLMKLRVHFVSSHCYFFLYAFV